MFCENKGDSSTFSSPTVCSWACAGGGLWQVMCPCLSPEKWVEHSLPEEGCLELCKWGSEWSQDGQDAHSGLGLLFVFIMLLAAWLIWSSRSPLCCYRPWKLCLTRYEKEFGTLVLVFFFFMFCLMLRKAWLVKQIARTDRPLWLLGTRSFYLCMA